MHPFVVSTPGPNKSLPASLAMLSVGQSLRHDQRRNIKAIKPIMEILQQGPWTAEEALNKGIIDGIGYHHDLLNELQRAGVKTWSLRKYVDATIIQEALGRFDLTRLVLPQILGKKGKKEQTSKDESTEPKKPDLIVNFGAILNPPNSRNADPKFGLRAGIIVPRNVGLIYLDSAIEGYVLMSMELTKQERKVWRGGNRGVYFESRSR
jgi:hypothetical protein